MIAMYSPLSIRRSMPRRATVSFSPGRYTLLRSRHSIMEVPVPSQPPPGMPPLGKDPPPEGMPPPLRRYCLLVVVPVEPADGIDGRSDDFLSFGQATGDLRIGVVGGADDHGLVDRGAVLEDLHVVPPARSVLTAVLGTTRASGVTLVMMSAVTVMPPFTLSLADVRRDGHVVADHTLADGTRGVHALDLAGKGQIG